MKIVWKRLDSSSTLTKIESSMSKLYVLMIFNNQYLDVGWNKKIFEPLDILVQIWNYKIKLIQRSLRWFLKSKYVQVRFDIVCWLVIFINLYTTQLLFLSRVDIFEKAPSLRCNFERLKSKRATEEISYVQN